MEFPKDKRILRLQLIQRSSYNSHNPSMYILSMEQTKLESTNIIALVDEYTEGHVRARHSTFMARIIAEGVSSFRGLMKYRRT